MRTETNHGWVPTLLEEDKVQVVPGGAGAPTHHSLCLHYDLPTTWGFKMGTQITFLKWGDYTLL